METILFAIVIGVLSTVYRMMKKIQTGTSPTKPLSKRKSDIQKVYNKVKADLVGQPAAPIQNKISDSEANGMMSIEKEMIMKKSSLRNEPIYAVSGKLENDQTYSVELSEQKNLIDAVIWSEILGQPRSKNPFFSRRNQ